MPDRKKSERKKFVFPENVSSSYGVFLGLSLKELVTYALPVLVVGIIALLLPPHTMKPTLVKITIIILIMTVVLAVLSSRPVPYRNNIKLTEYMRLKRNYKNRQHLFFREKNKRN
ncbi:MAG: conjugal transfer protein [Staphylococcus equorum]|nr:conjugal transfer protein [Staphylococcus equorum]